jgi:hypothetical protein
LIGHIFDDITIERVDSAGNQVAAIRVPIIYSRKDKMLERVLQDPMTNRATAITASPMIAFEMTGIRYRREDKLTTTSKVSVRAPANTQILLSQYQNVPYDIEFSVYVYSKDIEDGNRVMEQILPFFTPDWTTSVELIPDTNEIRDLPVTLNSVSGPDDNYEGDISKHQTVIWTLNLTLKGYFYGPIRSQGVIKFAQTNFRVAHTQNIADAVGVTNTAAYFNTQPGLTANGQPTSNLALTVPWQTIDIDSDYGYIVSLYEPEASNTLANDEHYVP